MAKKDFAGLLDNNDLGENVNANIENATTTKGQRRPATPQEIEERRENGTTQGRLGAKALRINMAFTPSNYNFLKTVARLKGMTVTQYTNLVISEYKKEHSDIMEKVAALIRELDGEP